MQNILLYNKVSLLFLVVAMTYGFVTTGVVNAVVTFVVSLAVMFLVRVFREEHDVRHTYMVGIALTLAAMQWFYAMALLPFMLFFLVKPLEAFSLRNVMAMLLGVFTPLWLYLPYWLYIHIQAMDWLLLQEQLRQAGLSVSLFNYADVNALQAIIYGILLLLFLVLTVNRSSYRYKGKMFVRSQRTIYITLTWLIALAVIVLPSEADYLLPLMAACIGPVAAQVSIGDGRMTSSGRTNT